MDAGVDVLQQEKPLGAFPCVRGVGLATLSFYWPVSQEKVPKQRCLLWFGFFVVDMGSVGISILSSKVFFLT